MIRGVIYKSLLRIPKYNMDLKDMRINYSSNINLYEFCKSKDPFDIFKIFF